MSDPATIFLARLAEHQLSVGVVGLGYIGLPLARAFSARRFRVLGFDVAPDKIAQLQNGKSYIGHLGDGAIAAMQAQGFEATADFSRLAEPDALVICVPTPLTEARTPDLSFVTRSVQAVAVVLRPGQLVVLESTTYPGTTREVVLPLLEAGGLKCGQDFFVAFSPEREDPGNPIYSAPNIPKVVGGIDPVSLRLAAALYARVVVQVVPVSSAEVAEACKLLENTYRAVNIALVNELKVLYNRLGIDIWEVIDAARTKPFGFQAFYPGPGLGGHCIPIDPFYLAWLARQHGSETRFIELAGEVNAAMPAYVVDKVAEALQDRNRPVPGSKVLLLGMAYKRDVDDSRESPGLALLDRLLGRGALVEYNDPHIPHIPVTRRYPQLRQDSRPLTVELLQGQDCVVIVTDHSAYNWEWVVEHSRLVIDTRNATREVRSHRERIVRA